MGRYSTGAKTTGQIQRIELSYLLKQGIIKKHHSYNGSLSWNNESSISINSVYNDSEAYIELSYITTVFATNEKTSYKYKIELETIPSNLGKGEIIYFVCPESHKKCRILYKAYGSGIWKARKSYQNRIYYESQIEPKSIRPYKYFFIDNLMSELHQKAKKKHYKGKPTRIMKRIQNLQNKHNFAMLDYDKFERFLCGIK